MTSAQPSETKSGTAQTAVNLTVGLTGQSAGEPAVSSARVSDGRANVFDLVRSVMDQVSALAARVSLPAMRVALALVYIWFGALKVAGKSDVFQLVAATLPFVNANVFVPALGVIEIILGIGLLTNRFRRVVLVGVIGHLIGTFLTFVTTPSMMMHNGNVLLMNMNGEFVWKNLVLISGALILLGTTSKMRTARVTSTDVPVARAAD